MQNKRYPRINIRSKNELAKHISSKRLPYKDALALINDALDNFDQYWFDHPTMSQPDKGKWVRDSSRTNLGRLLKEIDARILKVHDGMLPNFIFGGVSGMNHKAAVKHLLGTKRKRIMLKLDVSRFFEQIGDDRVRSFFAGKCDCSDKASRILAKICCVEYGPKEAPVGYKTIARGFSTSPRLAVWCNLDTFLKIDRLIKKELKGKDPRIAIFFDDIGITASGVTKEVMMNLYPKIQDILENGDENQKLPLNNKKTKIVKHSGETYDIGGSLLGRWGFEHLGLQMNRNSLSLGTKTRWKLVSLTERFKATKRKNNKLRRSRKSTLVYKKYIER